MKQCLGKQPPTENSFKKAEKLYHRLEMVFGQMGVDWEDRTDFVRLRKERTERARRSLKKHGLDALIAFDFDNVRYITGTFGNVGRALAASRYCVLPAEGEPILFELGPDVGRQKQCAKWLEGRIRVAKALSFLPRAMYKDWGEEMKDTLVELGVSSGNVGLDSLNMDVVNALTEAHVEFKDGRKAIWDARKIKTKDEIECLKTAVMLAEPALEAARQNIKPGARDCDVQGEVAKVLFSNCCWIYHGGGNFASGEHTNPYWRVMLTDRVMREGDLVIIDRIHTFNGYACDYVRTFLCGQRATDEQKTLYRKCYDKLYDAIRIIRPGVTTKEIAEKWNEPEDFSEITLDFAHGMGLSSHEPPHATFLSKKYPETIERDMVMAVETYYGEPGGKQGVRLEENLVVTDSGYELISKYPHDERLFEG